MTAFLDAMLVYDPAGRRSDLVLGADGDLVMDETPATPMLISLGSDRRARPDDPLPTGGGSDQTVGESEPASLTVRRGWPGDALDAEQRVIGSRLWLLDRAKQTELTRRFAEEWGREALSWARAETGRAASVAAVWIRRGVLALSCNVDGRAVTINRQVG